MWTEIKEKMMNMKKNPGYIVAGALFSVAASLNLFLFLELAGSNVAFEIIFTLLSLGLDGSMIVLWIRGTREKNIVFVLISFALMLQSLLCSSGSSLMIVKQDDEYAVALKDTRTKYSDAVDQAKLNEKSWADRLSKVPPEYTSQLKVVGGFLNEAHEETKRATDALNKFDQDNSNEGVKSSKTSMFALLADELGIDRDRFKLWFLQAMSILLEVAAFALSYKKKDQKESEKTLVIDALGISHVLVKGKSLCGKAGPFTKEQRVRRPCAMCMERSFLNG